MPVSRQLTNRGYHVHPNYWRGNVKSQEQDPSSHLNIFKRLVTLRKTPVAMHGDLKTYVLNTWVYMFTRSINDETIAVLMKVGSETEEICDLRITVKELPEIVYVHTASINSVIKIGDKVNFTGPECLYMRPQSGLVLAKSHGIAVSSSIVVLLATICSRMLL